MTPANTPGIYGKIHFKNIAVGIIALDEQGNTYLVGQYRFPLNEYSWEIPEGGCPEGTDILTSAKRELKEETGFEANQWTELLRMYLSNSVSDEYVVVFIAQDLVAGEAEPVPHPRRFLWSDGFLRCSGFDALRLPGGSG